MKVKTSISDFNPFKLEISIESLEEARALYAIFNHTDNMRLFKNNHMLSDALSKYSVKGPMDVISNGIQYTDFYKKRVPV